MKGTIYKCVFSDGKVYIGKSIHAGQRMKEHFDKIAGPSNPGFYEAYQKLGEPTYEILFEEEFSNILDRECTLSGVESYYIDYYHATDPKYGYNIKNSSPFSAYSRKLIDDKVAELNKVYLEKRLDVYNCIMNKLLNTKEKLNSDELFFVKEKFREKNVWQRSIDNFNFDDYDKNTSYDFEFLIDDALPMIKCIIETDTEEEVWEYVCANADEFFNEKDEKDILKINDMGEIVKEYHSLNDICEEMNLIRPENIRNVLRGVQKKAYGYYWMYRIEYDKKKKQDNIKSLF